MKTAFIYSEEFEKFTYHPSHPLKPIRLKLTYELIKAYGLLGSFHHRFIKANPCNADDLLTVHSLEYVEAVERAAVELPEWERQYYGFNMADNQIFPQVYRWSLLATGASLQAAKLVESGEAKIAFNIAGGAHHASRNRASGFCYFNDAAVLIQYLLDKGYRVAYIDLDAHHGNGVQEIFYRTNRVLTISLHQNGLYAFPGTGFEREIGEEEGEGYSVNVPLLPASDDDVFWYAFNESVPPLLECFRPDILVTQLGVDTFRTDPLTSLEVTTSGFCRVVEALKQLSPGKWVALGGGGYDVLNVPRAWTLAWAIMTETDVPNPLPHHYLKLLHTLKLVDEKQLVNYKRLRDKRYQTNLKSKIHLLSELDKTIRYIKNRQLQMICEA